MSYFTQAEALAFLGGDVLVQLFDTNGTNTVDATQFALLASLADARVDAVLARVYRGPFPVTQTPVPQMVKLASLMWFKALSYARHSEYVRETGKELEKAAKDFCEDLAEAKDLINDWIQQPKPRNNGGFVFSEGHRMILTNSDGTSNAGDF